MTDKKEVKKEVKYPKFEVDPKIPFLQQLQQERKKTNE